MAEDALYIETGTIGQPVFGGRYGDRYLEELEGAEGIGVMAGILRMEPAAFVVNNAIQLSARQTRWSVTPAGDTPGEREAADFIESLMDDMNREWWRAVQFGLSSLAFGFSDLYIVWKRRMGPNPAQEGATSLYDDQGIGLRKLAVRRQETIERWIHDENGDPKFMVQLDPNTGNEYEPVPIEQLLHFTSGDARGGWEGLGWLEPAYKLYHMITNLEIILGVGLQRAHTGLPVFAYKVKPDSETKSNVESIGRNLTVNQQQFVTYPEEIVDFRLESATAGNAGDLQNAIDQLRWELSTLALTQFVRLGSSASGSRALGEPLIKLFVDGVDSALSDVASVLNRHLVPRILKFNPDLAAKIPSGVRPPQFTHTSVGSKPLPLEVASVLADIDTFMRSAADEDALWIRDIFGMPEIDVSAIPDAPEPLLPVPGAPGEQVKPATQPAEDEDEELSEGLLTKPEMALMSVVAKEYRKAGEILSNYNGNGEHG